MAHGAWSRSYVLGGTASAAGVSVVTGRTVAGPREEEEDAESRVTTAEDPRGRRGTGLMTEGTEVMVSNSSQMLFLPSNRWGGCRGLKQGLSSIILQSL